MKNYKKLVAWILSIAMLVSSISFPVSADDETAAQPTPIEAAQQTVDTVNSTWDAYQQGQEQVAVPSEASPQAGDETVVAPDAVPSTDQVAPQEEVVAPDEAVVEPDATGVTKTWNIGTMFPAAQNAVENNEVKTVDDLTLYGVTSASGTAFAVQSTGDAPKALTVTDGTVNSGTRLNTNGKGSAVGTTGATPSRAISFQVEGASTIEVVTCSANTTEDRTLVVETAAGTNVGTFTALKNNNATAYTSQTINYTGGATTIYMYGGVNSVHVYYIKATNVKSAGGASTPTPSTPTPSTPTPSTPEPSAQAPSTQAPSTGTTKIWNIGAMFTEAATAVENGATRTVDDLTFIGFTGASGTAVTVQSTGATAKTLTVADGTVTSAFRINTNGAGAGGTTPNRAISFQVNGPSTIEVVTCSANTADDRNLIVETAEGTNIATLQALKNNNTIAYTGQVINYTGGATTIYMYGGMNSVHVYYVKATNVKVAGGTTETPTPTASAPPTATPVPGAATPPPTAPAKQWYATVTAPWQATVYGNVPDGNRKPEVETVLVKEVKPGLVNLRMSKGKATGVAGKVDSSSDGFVYYFQPVSKTDNFVLKANMVPEGYTSTDAQVSFGAMVRNDMVIDAAAPGGKYGNYIASGILGIPNPVTGLTPPMRAFLRLDNTLTNSLQTGAHPEFAIKGYDGPPSTGEAIPVGIKKVGTFVEITYGDQDPIVLDTKNVNGKGGDMFSNSTIYAGFYVVRDADVMFQNPSFQNTTRQVTDWRIDTTNAKKEFAYKEKYSDNNLVVQAQYAGQSGYVDVPKDEYIVSGYNSNVLGERTLQVNFGSESKSYKVNIGKAVVSSLTITQPNIAKYHLNDKFSLAGCYLTANYATGGSDIYPFAINSDDKTPGALQPEQYTISLAMPGEQTSLPLTIGQVLTTPTKSLDNGQDNVSVTLKNTDLVTSENTHASFTIEVVSNELSGIEIYRLPAKTLYYVNEVSNYSGLLVQANYGGNRVLLAPTDYEITGFDTTKAAASEKITISYQGKVVNFTIKVADKSPIAIEMTKYPQTTYALNEPLDLSDASMTIVFDNSRDDKNNDKNDDTKKEAIQFDSNVATAVNTAIAGTYRVLFTPKAISADDPRRKSDDPIVKELMRKIDAMVKQYQDQPITLIFKVRPQPIERWESVVFGQSSSGSSVTTINSSGTSVTTTSGAIKVQDYTLAPNITVSSKDGKGKITGDHDGIAYYFTTLSTSENFEITADIKVNYYMIGNADKSRSGQEAFGIMARDAIPFQLNDDKTPKLTDDGYKIPSSSSAVFASNIAMVGGYSGATFPSDPLSTSYKEKSTINRIDLVVRKDVSSPSSGGTMSTPLRTNDAGDAPKLNETYRVTLIKDNTGFTASSVLLLKADGTVNTGAGSVPVTQTITEPNILSAYDKDNMYLGFFAAREAEINVTNVKFSRTEASTDKPGVPGQQAAVVPRFTVESLLDTPFTNYSLMLKPNCAGFITVRQGSATIAQDVRTTGAMVTIPTTLAANKTTTFTVTFTPDELAVVTSKAPVVVQFDVKNQKISNEKTIYVSPTGNQNATGTHDDPLDLDTAVQFSQLDQKIIMLAGEYKRSETLTIPALNNGMPTGRRCLWAEERTDGKRPILNFDKKCEGIVLAGSYWHLKGFDVTKSGDNTHGVSVAGKNNIVEGLNIYKNGDTGLQISRIGNSNSFADWPSDNLILNCTSSENADPSSNNADGFASKLTSGNGNIFRGCIAHHNVDDGWDLYTKLASGAIGSVLIENCVAYQNGYRQSLSGDSVAGLGDKNGFKLGGENVPVKHIIRNSITFENGADGLTCNSNPYMIAQNVVSYNNVGKNVNLYSDSKDNFRYDLNGIISFRTEYKINGTAVGSKDSMPGDPSGPNGTAKTGENKMPIRKANNYFMFNFSSTTAFAKNELSTNGQTGADAFFTADKFESLDKTGVVPYNRDANGDIVFGNFLKLKAGWLYTIPTEPTPTPAPTGQTGGSSGGTGGGGGGGTEPAKTTDTKTEPGKAPVVEKVLSEQKVDKAQFEALLKSTEDAKAPVSFKFDDAKANTFTASMPASAFVAAERTVDVEVPGVSVKIPASVLGGMTLAPTDVVTFEVTKATLADAALQEKFGDNIVTISTYVNDKVVDVHDLAKPITVAFDYVGAVKDAYKVVAVYCKDDGTKEIIRNSMYDAVTNKVTFKTNHLSVFAFEESTKTFEDIQNSWSKEYVELLAVRGIINGKTEDTFAPSAAITRADFVKILIGALDKSEKAKEGFADVTASDYYYNQVLTAKALSLISGVTPTLFGPKEEISRQDAMCVIDRTLSYIGFELKAKDNLAGFSDATDVSGYAVESVQKLVAAGVIAGNNGKINPKATLTRAEAAKMLTQVFLQSIQ